MHFVIESVPSIIILTNFIKYAMSLQKGVFLKWNPKKHLYIIFIRDLMVT